MKKFIKVKSSINNLVFYVCPTHIGYMYSTLEYGDRATVISLTTHNNGGLKVKETIEEIMEQINELYK